MVINSTPITLSQYHYPGLLSLVNTPPVWHQQDIIIALTLLGKPDCNVEEVRMVVTAVHSCGASAFSCFTWGKATTQLGAEHWASCIREDGSRLGLSSMAQGWVELERAG